MSTERQGDLTAYAVTDNALSEYPATAGGEQSLRVVGGSQAGGTGWRPISSARLDRAYVRIKYPVERFIGVFVFLVTIPVMFLVAGLIRFRMGPGVLYTQERVGLGGETFRIVKFRTMDTDRRTDHLDFVGEDRRRTHKTTDDPRHTRLGSLLRSTSLDELPQLWNVVRGEMALVGPRPELASVVDKYDLWDHPRHRMKPGITGLWQVSEHRHELLHEHMDVDLDYLETVSWWTDVRILSRTMLMPFDRTGS